MDGTIGTSMGRLNNKTRGLGRVDELFVDSAVEPKILSWNLLCSFNLESWATIAFLRIRQQTLSRGGGWKKWKNGRNGWIKERQSTSHFLRSVAISSCYLFNVQAVFLNQSVNGLAIDAGGNRRLRDVTVVFTKHFDEVFFFKRFE